MNTTSRLITGIIAIVLGFCLFVAGFFTMFISWIYGIPILIIGIFILFNKKEDSIEKRRDGTTRVYPDKSPLEISTKGKRRKDIK